MLQYILAISSDVMCTFSRYDYTWLFAISFNKVDKHLEYENRFHKIIYLFYVQGDLSHHQST